VLAKEVSPVAELNKAVGEQRLAEDEKRPDIRARFAN
jgi:hypothetical protein